jgi:DNA-binding XRE family transcriptional regulator
MTSPYGEPRQQRAARLQSRQYGLLPAPILTARTRSAQTWTTLIDGRRLRQLRRQHGLSQEKLAYRAGISLSTVARLERQPYSLCRCRTLARIAAVLGEDPATISAPGSRPSWRAAVPTSAGTGNRLASSSARTSA